MTELLIFNSNDINSNKITSKSEINWQEMLKIYQIRQLCLIILFAGQKKPLHLKFTKKEVGIKFSALNQIWNPTPGWI